MKKKSQNMPKIGIITMHTTGVLFFDVIHNGKKYYGGITPKNDNVNRPYQYNIIWTGRPKFGELGLRSKKKNGEKYLAGYFLDYDNAVYPIVWTANCLY